ncbi:MAG: Coenzyme F420 hydrogenase/dehydrogenase, beta subunit C-terminal domain [Nitrososphaeria archaeon]
MENPGQDIDQSIKSFDDLLEEVIQPGLCARCQGCVSFCSAGELNALRIGEDEVSAYVDKEKCLKDGICYLICPRTTDLDKDLKERFDWRPPIGTYRSVTSARTTDPEVRQVCTDGGVVTSLLDFLLGRNLAGGAVVSRKTGVWSRQATVATTREELVEAAGSHFSEASHLEELGQKYCTTFSPILPAVKKLRTSRAEAMAVVGTPCQISSIRKMQVLGILPAHIVRYTIGLFCMESFSFDELSRRRLEKKLNLNLADIQKLNVKDDFMITLSGGVTVHVPLEEVDLVARSACLACPDFSNEYADLSVGGLGSPDGYTTVLVRTRDGQEIFEGALRHKYIEEREHPTVEDLRSEKTKTVGKIVSWSIRKRERADKRRKELPD